ncbi:hypothetical protein ABOM_003366 [Aspergillus bombycis]|uniref:Thiol methyltransferase n=1 Tax=Aspergillus bombycis TaxID=109264 RepID=A0A1F8AAL7_9EURO|nr:hypothetical protein ABOM_003366 [Aspergillus bombycis]OGM48378.1 hypothetical protein ABOM_003366 [Aspergillus bombycis]
MTGQTNIDPKDIQAHLSNYKGDKYVEGWATLWDQGDSLPWDKGFPNPALEDALAQRRAIISEPIAWDAQGRLYRRKALVPGCGRGVDVLLLASFGYDAYGLEYSATAVDACKKEAEEHHTQYPVQDQTIGRGKVTFVQGDFFDDAWLQKIEGSANGFDLVYDYTFFCALRPALRPKWALRHTQLLAPSPIGKLICLEFPLHKDPQAPGPPYPLSSEVYMAHLSHPGEEIPYDDNGRVQFNPLQEPSEAGLKRVAYWQPERTHKVGQDEDGVIHDRVSIWSRRS